MRSMRTQQERRRFKEVRVRRNKEALLKIHMKKNRKGRSEYERDLNLSYVYLIPEHFTYKCGFWSKLSVSYQSLVGHVSLILQLNQPPLQIVPGSLGLLPQLLLSLQTLPLHLKDRHLERVQGNRSVSLLSEWWRTSGFPFTTCFLALSSLAWAFICWTSSESTRRRRINRSWFPMQSWRICTRWKQKAVTSAGYD